MVEAGRSSDHGRFRRARRRQRTAACGVWWPDAQDRGMGQVMKRVLLIGAVLAALCLAMIWHLSPAHADGMPCAPLKPLIDHLVKDYHEVVVMTGDATGHQMI